MNWAPGILRTLFEGVAAAMASAWGQPYFLSEDRFAPWLYGGLSACGVVLGAWLAYAHAREARAIARAPGPFFGRALRLAGRSLGMLASALLAVGGACGVALVARAIYMS